MTRQTKTPRQRATETLAAARRDVDRLRAERAKHQAGCAACAATELAQAERRLAHAQDNPDLRDTETGAGE